MKRRTSNSKVPHRNQSPYGWWVASYVERVVWDDEPNPSLSSRCLAWENTIILKAKNRDAAYKKAIRLSRNYPCALTNEHNRTGHWVFDGLTSLLPIYEELKDGAEIFWAEHANRTVKKILSMVKQKEELEIFDDTPSIGDLPYGGAAAKATESRS